MCMSDAMSWLQAQGGPGAVGWDLRALLQMYWPQILFLAVIVIVLLVLVSRKPQRSR
jgi:hypothetical protein